MTEQHKQNGEKLKMITQENHETIRRMQAAVQHDPECSAKHTPFVEGFARLFFLIEMLFQRERENDEGGISRKSIKLWGFEISNYAMRDVVRFATVLGVWYVILSQLGILPEWIALKGNTP